MDIPGYLSNINGSYVINEEYQYNKYHQLPINLCKV